MEGADEVTLYCQEHSGREIVTYRMTSFGVLQLYDVFKSRIELHAHVREKGFEQRNIHFQQTTAKAKATCA